MMLRFPTLTDEQRDILTGIAVKAAAETITVVVAVALVGAVLWLAVSLVWGSAELVRWLGGLG